MFKYLTSWEPKKIKKHSEPVNPLAFFTTPPTPHLTRESLSPPPSPLSPELQRFPGAPCRFRLQGGVYHW